MNTMILAPIAYIIIIIGSMATFSSLYRKRQAIQAASMEPWFKPSPARDMYLTLLHLDSGAKVPDSVLRAALLQRAVTMIHRAITVKNAKAPLQQLLQRGSVGDDTWTQFQAYEKDLDRELREIIEEANSLSPGGNWGQTIFQSAAEMAHNERFKKKIEIQEEKTAELSKWWEAKAAKIRAEFLKSEGLEDDSKKPAARPVSSGRSEKSTSSPVASPAQIPATVITPAPSETSPTEKNGGSDEDVVVVDSEATPFAGSPAGSPAMSPAARSGSISGAGADGGSVGGSMRKKKKKGKK